MQKFENAVVLGINDWNILPKNHLKIGQKLNWTYSKMAWVWDFERMLQQSSQEIP